MDLHLVTARYASFVGSWPTVDHVSVVPVVASIGRPRFIVGSDRWPRASELAPWGLLDIDDPVEFEARYRDRLDAHGIETIIESLTAIARRSPGRPLALLCFEDLSKQWCHRRMAARWLEQQTGVEVPELPEPQARLFA